MDYRGYGSSTGTPTEEGIKLDAEAVFKYAKTCNLIDSSKIILFGKSLGGAVAIYLAEKYDFQILATILENTFTSISSLVDQYMPLLKHLKYYVLRNHWNSLESIKKVKQPILFIYGEFDEIIDNHHMQILHKEAKSAIYKEIFMVPNGDHNMCYTRVETNYLPTIYNFIKTVVSAYSLPRFEEVANVQSTDHSKVD